MNPANFYYGYNPNNYAFSPPNYPYPQIPHPLYRYSQPPFQSPMQAPMMPQNPQVQMNHLPPYGRPTINNMNSYPRRQAYRNMQNDFSRGFEFDYDFMPNETFLHNSQPIVEWNSTHCLNNSLSNNQPYKRIGENERKFSESPYKVRCKPRLRSRSFKTPKIIKSCQRNLTKAGILFTAIIYSVCDCLFAPESSSFSDLTVKLLQALDGSRLDLSKLMLPHDRLLTEESIEDLEFEILENRANKLEKEEHSAFSLYSKKKSWKS